MASNSTSTNKNQTATTKPNGASNCCNSVIFIDAD
jgi:hypothetical protein